ncbi:hypothetical protein D3C87_656820 [compost metagenome]|nr:hypothetical protein PS934_00866 [Pseudomonas fluorescens]
MYVLCLREDRERPNGMEPCGSLLAIAVGQSTSMLNVMQPSRASSLPQGYSLLAVTRLALRIEIIQRPIHRQLAQHDDLRNPQQRIAMRALQKPRKVTGHDAGRSQGFAGVGQ